MHDNHCARCRMIKLEANLLLPVLASILGWVAEK